MRQKVWSAKEAELPAIGRGSEGKGGSKPAPVAQQGGEGGEGVSPPG